MFEMTAWDLTNLGSISTSFMCIWNLHVQLENGYNNGSRISTLKVSQSPRDVLRDFTTRFLLMATDTTTFYSFFFSLIVSYLCQAARKEMNISQQTTDFDFV